MERPSRFPADPDIYENNLYFDWILMRHSKVQKKRENYMYLYIQSWRFGGFYPPSSGFWKVAEGNTTQHSPISPLSVAVKIFYNFSLSAEFSVIISLLLNLGLPHQNPFNSFTSPSPKTTSIYSLFPNLIIEKLRNLFMYFNHYTHTI